MAAHTQDKCVTLYEVTMFALIKNILVADYVCECVCAMKMTTRAMMRDTIMS